MTSRGKEDSLAKRVGDSARRTDDADYLWAFSGTMYQQGRKASKKESGSEDCNPTAKPLYQTTLWDPRD